MESTAADAMPDDTDLTPQAPEPEQAPAESNLPMVRKPALNKKRKKKKKKVFSKY